ncbi:MAG: hypothetical protein P8X57_06340 [Cyclobacteriaceae bacterium]
MRFVSSLGETQSRFFINIADAGMGAEVVRKVNERSKWMGPSLTFFRAILETFLSYRNVQADIRMDKDRYQGPIRSAVFANGRYFGSGMCIAPDAKPDDGIFAVVIIGNVSIADYLKYLPRIKKGEFIDHPEVSYYTAKKIELYSPSKLELEADGEFIGFAPVQIEIRPKTLTVL